MQKNLQNALALLRKFGGSDLFITFTANPRWKEITEALLPNQAPHDRPDLIACVFNLKVDSLLDDIMQKGIFGKAEGHVHTVKYQKRGLPHIHLIVFLAHSSCLSTPEAIDQCISTEFPSETHNPHLFQTVKKFMVHGPCGLGLSLPCSGTRGKCTKGFLKTFKSDTEIMGESYVQTRRRDMGHFVQIGDRFVDNCSIVSYSPFLLLKYDAHINIECTTGFSAIKYIYKVLSFFLRHDMNRCLPLSVQYVYKGPDCALVSLHANYNPHTYDNQFIQEDEIKLYIDARYISASEAVAQLIGWPTHKVCSRPFSIRNIIIQLW